MAASDQGRPRLGDDAVAVADDTADEAAIAEAEADGKPRFRVLRRQGWRKAFRLEAIFWETLEAAARENGLRLTEFVHDRVAGRPGNQASALRVAATGWLWRRYGRLRKKTAPARLIGLLQAAPVPSFAIDQSRRLVAHNREFVDLVRADTLVDSESHDISTARLALDAPLDALIGELGKNPEKILTCGYTIRLGATRRVGRARVILVPAEKGRTIVGYILS
jgi:predicted DNA-binding ribbon-helix-helix protein